MEFWLWMPQLFACTRTRIKTQINRGLSPIIHGFGLDGGELGLQRVLIHHVSLSVSLPGTTGNAAFKALR